MKFNLLCLFIIFLSLSAAAQQTYFIKYNSFVNRSEIEQKVSDKEIFNSDALLENNISSFEVDFLAKNIAREDEVIGKIIKIQFDEAVDENLFQQLVSSEEGIEYIQIAGIYKMDLVPNDSMLADQWGLEKIKAFDAWDITTGADTVLLCIIDTGMDYDHPDLTNKIYLNQGEIGTDGLGRDKTTNGIDDDGNGFIDDYRGWDFTDRVGFPFDSTGGDYLNWDNNPYDDQGHGTYISGIAGAEFNNITGIAGAAPNIKMLNLRAFDPGGFGEEDDVAAAILYAVESGAKVINMSFGDNSFSLVLRDVIRYAYSQGVVLVASAGNSGSSAPHYPSGYSEVIAVGNSTIDDFVAGNSNFGSTIDLVAPGTQIVTTARNNNYASINGTSASAPFVSAAASLILSIQNFTNEEIKQILKSTTDDIGEPGWDLRSGAGRLNMNRALNVIAPAVIKFNSPRQDFATLENQLSVNATILSPFFNSFDLLVGTGFNPTDWTTLISNGTNQFSNQNIYDLDISSFADTVYNIRLIVYLNNGGTLEERVNFYVNRTPPVAELISVGPAFYGDKTTIFASIFTDEPCLTRMYFREFGTSEFSVITLDGFTTNNQFIKQLHYGFIPKQLVEQNSGYEVYFEAENLVGLTTEIKDNGSLFQFATDFDAELAASTQLPFMLPAGSIFQDPVSVTTTDDSEIFLRELLNPKISKLLKLDNQEFIQLDSLEERIIKSVGDFNNNGLTDLLGFFIRNGYVLEQTGSQSASFNEKYSNETGSFWPVMVQDFHNNGSNEVLVVENDSTFGIWNVNNDLSLTKSRSISNFTNTGFGGNIINSPHAQVSDINGDGIEELWFVDLDGDIFSYELQNGDFQEGSVIETQFLGSSSFLAAGDYNGDGIEELAVLLHSVDAIDIAPFYRLIIFNLINNEFNVLYDWAFIDAATEFISGTFQQADNSIRFVDIDSDSDDELVLFVFPYSYIFNYDFSNNKIVSYKENINSNSIFAGDLNKNGVVEIAFPTNDGIAFYEFSPATKATTPYNVNGFSIDSSTSKITWSGNTDFYYIYRGESVETLELLDSVIVREYVDPFLTTGNNYFYAIQSFDPLKPEPYSNLSKAVTVYTHTPAYITEVQNNSTNSLIVRFSEKINNTIENLQAFEVTGIGYPNSISPNNQFSYLLTFSDDLPVGLNSLIVGNLRDFYGSPIETDTVQFNVDSIIVQDEFFVNSFEILNAYRIKVTFNLPVDQSSAFNTANYKFNPDNKVTAVTIDNNDPKVIYLSLEGQKPVGSIGKEYVLRIEDVYSSQQNGNLKINSGAGSYLVLTGFAKDLSDVYVYPNPVKTGEGDIKLTFANLPQRAKITIFSINGEQIWELEETNGDGGVDFNLKNYSGDEIGSGIYFYRVVMIDESNNEGDEKIGKFAVVR